MGCGEIRGAGGGAGGLGTLDARVEARFEARVDGRFEARVKALDEARLEMEAGWRMA